MQAAAATRSAVLLSVLGDLAHDYIDLRGLQARLRIMRNDVDAATQTRIWCGRAFSAASPMSWICNLPTGSWPR